MHEDVTFRDIDLASDVMLQAATQQRHGAALLAAAASTIRMFELSSPWARGMRFVGAEAECTRMPGVVPITTRFNLAGSGCELQDAIASCLGECVERLSQIEHSGDIVERLSVQDTNIMPSLRELIAQRLARPGSNTNASLDWMIGRLLGSDERQLVPADWILRRAMSGPLFDASTALSTGAAAGRTIVDASIRGLLELVERDAVAQWWLGGSRGRPLRGEDCAAMAATDLLRELRRNSTERRTWLLDITSDLDIPVVAAMSVASDGRSFACGTASRQTMSEAAKSAILELCQMELGLMLTRLRLAERGGAGLSEGDRRNLARSVGFDASRCELLYGVGTARHPVGVGRDSNEECLASIIDVFARSHIDAVLVDLTRQAFAIPVVRAIAPALQLMPSDLKTARLAAAHARGGGGARWTEGFPLM